MAGSASIKYGTVIKQCGCTHPYQDRQYGKGNRVWNRGPKGMKCTVCAKQIGEAK